MCLEEAVELVICLDIPGQRVGACKVLPPVPRLGGYACSDLLAGLLSCVNYALLITLTGMAALLEGLGTEQPRKGMMS